ncbi:hypothetical protein BC832DRAFT_107349 [Gaertneriomyces semiglobifer]|nr:hypothetical protein BC832DRAFT_107349 [Gaertneriomyces semiglobifer]
MTRTDSAIGLSSDTSSSSTSASSLCSAGPAEGYVQGRRNCRDDSYIYADVGSWDLRPWECTPAPPVPYFLVDAFQRGSRRTPSSTTQDRKRRRKPKGRTVHIEGQVVAVTLPGTRPITPLFPPSEPATRPVTAYTSNDKIAPTEPYNQALSSEQQRPPSQPTVKTSSEKRRPPTALPRQIPAVPYSSPLKISLPPPEEPLPDNVKDPTTFILPQPSTLPDLPDRVKLLPHKREGKVIQSRYAIRTRHAKDSMFVGASMTEWKRQVGLPPLL